MRAVAAVVADDLTGAADAGAGFQRSGLATIVTWANPELDLGLVERADVLAIDTRTRAAAARQAGEITGRVLTALRLAGVGTIYKKADSMLRGHIGVEAKAALAAWHPGSVAIVALAFPDAGRTTVDGRQRVDGIPLEGAGLPAMLEQAGVATRCANLACVRAASLREAFAEYRDLGVAAIVCDAETGEDLRAIARAGTELGSHVIWVGTGGLAPAVAERLGLTGMPLQQPTVSVTGPVLIAVGSATDLARAQAADLAEAGVAHVRIPIGTLDGTAVDRAGVFGRKIEELLRRPVDVVVTLGGATDAGQPGDDRLTARLGALLQPCAELVGGLVATGGETAAAILLAWGTTALRLVEEVEPGVPLSISIAARPIPVVTKAGSFGSPRSLTNARARLKMLLEPGSSQSGV
jgi:uncharacterized protein YgbK (DUF1537 family)